MSAEFANLQNSLGISQSSKPTISPFDRPVPPKPPLSAKQQEKKKKHDEKIAKKKPMSKHKLIQDPKKDPRCQK